MRWLVLAALFALVCADEHSHKYEPGEQVVLWMDTVGPYDNRQETYTYFSLPFCQGSQSEVGHYHETLGEALQGVELQNSGAAIKFKEKLTRAELCTVRPSATDARKFQYAVTHNYVAQMYIDDLPVMALIGAFENSDGTKTDRPQAGARYYLWSHKRFEISYNGDQIVAVTMEQDKKVEILGGTPITFTYSVNWVESTVPFKDRFDRYLDPSFFQHKIHWFSLFNSFMMVLFLCGLVTMILMRTLRRDFARYSRDEPMDELERDLDEYGWKQVHADVFRPPAHPLLFSSLIGTGAHLFACAGITLLLAMWGDMYEERGQTLTTMILVYTATAMVGGFVSGGLYARLGGKRWIRQMFAQASLFPVFVCTVNLGVNLVALSYSSTRAIPFTTMLKISALGLFVVFPLTLLGTILGRHMRGTAHWPCRINPVPRPIPEAQWYLDPLVITLLGGALPFASIFIEMYFVFTSFWAYKVYYVYGFMFLVFTMLLIVTVCVDIVCIYFLLNGEDYRWWWVSYGTAASTGLYVFMYSVYYFVFKTKMYGFFQTTFYFSYTMVLCVALAMMTGAIGHMGASVFVRRIYQNIKID